MSLVTREARPRAFRYRKFLSNESTDDFSNRNRHSGLGIEQSRVIISHVQCTLPSDLISFVFYNVFIVHCVYASCSLCSVSSEAPTRDFLRSPSFSGN